MKSFFLIILFSFAIGVIYSQNLFILGTKSYKASPELEFTEDQPDPMTPKVSLVFFKNGDEIWFSFKVHFSGSTCARGKLLIYLDNGEVITCIDKSKYDEVNYNCSTIFRLTQGEANAILESNINQIRFNLKCVSCDASGKEGTFSVHNRSENPFSDERIDFSNELEKLLMD